MENNRYDLGRAEGHKVWIRWDKKQEKWRITVGCPQYVFFFNDIQEGLDLQIEYNENNFLECLPKIFIKDGEIIQIRQEMERLLSRIDRIVENKEVPTSENNYLSHDNNLVCKIIDCIQNNKADKKEETEDDEKTHENKKNTQQSPSNSSATKSLLAARHENTASFSALEFPTDFSNYPRAPEENSISEKRLLYYEKLWDRSKKN